MDKSHVGMGAHICPVCLEKHDEVVLLHRFLRPVLGTDEIVGWELCPEHLQMYQDGYVALVEVENQPRNLADAKRTGQIAHVRSEAWPHLFNVPLPPGGLCFVEKGTIDQLEKKNGTHPRETSSTESSS